MCTNLLVYVLEQQNLVGALRSVTLLFEFCQTIISTFKAYYQLYSEIRGVPQCIFLIEIRPLWLVSFCLANMIAMKSLACLFLVLLILLSQSLPSSAHEGVLNPLNKVLDQHGKLVSNDLGLFQTRKFRVYNRKRGRLGVRAGGRTTSAASSCLFMSANFFVYYPFSLVFY